MNVQEIAYDLWEKAGKPEGKSERFWYEAEKRAKLKPGEGYFKSRFKKLIPIDLPKYSGTRVLILPVLLQDIDSLPNDLEHFRLTYKELVDISPVKEGVAYLTIDEKYIKPGTSLRKPGLHIDGYGADNRPDDMSIWATVGLRYFLSSMWDEGAKKWMQGAAGIGGMITVSNPAGCRAWNKDFTGKILNNGNCEMLRDQFPNSESTIFEAGVAYWCNASCVHESMPMEKDCARTFVRLSMPSKAPWYEGYTKNPKGILPTGVVVPIERYPFAYGFGRTNEAEVILKG